MKDLTGALKKISSIAQMSDVSLDLTSDICAELADFIGGQVLLTDAHGKAIAQSDTGAKDKPSYEHMLTLPLGNAANRAATITVYSETPFDYAGVALLEVSGAIILLILKLADEASSARRDADAVKTAVGTLSYSELAAVLSIFREIGGEGITVAGHIADKLGIARSLVVTALRKLEGAGLIETRSLGVKGTYIKVINEVLLDELYKIRD